MQPDPEERPEYEDMARGFIRLAARLGDPFDSRTQHALLVTVRAFEIIDRRVDALRGERLRAAAFGSVLAQLGEESTAELTRDGELGARILALRALLDVPRVRREFIDAMRAFFRHTERLRTTRDAKEYLRCVLDEAKLAADMTMAAVPALRDAKRRRFFLRLAEVANLVDKLQDLRQDYESGEVAIAPSLGLHLELARAFAVKAAMLAIRSARPLALIQWGLPFLLPPKRALR